MEVVVFPPTPGTRQLSYRILSTDLDPCQCPVRGNWEPVMGWYLLDAGLLEQHCWECVTVEFRADYVLTLPLAMLSAIQE